MTYCYGIGALLVLIGTILKLTHWLPIFWENFLITAGFAIAVVIFILETFAKQHEDEESDDSCRDCDLQNRISLSCNVRLGRILIQQTFLNWY